MNSRILATLVCITAVGCGGSRPAAGTTVPAKYADPLDQRSGASFFELGRESAERGDTVRAEQYLQVAIQKGYEPRRALGLLLRVCLSTGRLRTALSYAEPELRRHPEDDELRYLAATIRLGLGQVHAARLELAGLLEGSPQHAAAQYLLGVVEADRLRDPRAARGHFVAYLELEPKGAHAPEVRKRLSNARRGPLAESSLAASEVRLDEVRQ